MKKYAYNEITFMQYIFLTFGMVVSISFLALPRVLAEKAGVSGWIALILCWAITLAASLIVIQVMKRYPDGTILDLLTRYLGKWAGKAGAILFALYFFFYGYTGLVYTVLITKQWLLPQTSALLLLILLLIPTYVIVRSGLRVLGKFVEMVILISLWIPLVYLLSLKDAHWLHLLPILDVGWKPLLSAISNTIYFHVGFVTTFILYPFLKHKQKAAKGIIISYTLTMLAYLFVTIACFAYFSPDEILAYNEPGINILRSLEFKFIERIEVLFIAFYVIIFSLSWMLPLYLCVFCTSWLFGKEDHRSHLRLLWLFIVVGTYFFMPTYNQSAQMNDALGKIGFYVEYVFPGCLLIYLYIHDRLGWGKHKHS
ncbi:endospore germination permease [Paenibacillus sp. N3.4]|uniref:GerAB/ArcD/ProY family transporter n=1 Tax=Paenibacillus sp. N3.4 TaxID=2603222 RepID=UPI0011CBCC05|nr:endospore germination permease [Paenibacillus sp. N3.4]TXK81467.1 GerAB/ArcD/ProY family transporter [Paenibacillus sp. N3.4]